MVVKACIKKKIRMLLKAVKYKALLFSIYVILKRKVYIIFMLSEDTRLLHAHQSVIVSVSGIRHFYIFCSDQGSKNLHRTYSTLLFRFDTHVLPGVSDAYGGTG